MVQASCLPSRPFVNGYTNNFTTTPQRHNEQRRLQIIDYRFADWMDRGQVACRWHCAPRNNAYKITSNEQQSRNKLIKIPFFVTVHGLSASQTHNMSLTTNKVYLPPKKKCKSIIINKVWDSISVFLLIRPINKFESKDWSK